MATWTSSPSERETGMFSGKNDPGAANYVTPISVNAVSARNHSDGRSRVADVVVSAAKRWMRGNQLGRRNLTPESVAYLRGKLYREEKKVVTNPGGANQHSVAEGNSCPQPTTAEALAERFKTSPRTIKNDAKFSEQLDDRAGAPLTRFQSRGRALTSPDARKRADASASVFVVALGRLTRDAISKTPVPSAHADRLGRLAQPQEDASAEHERKHSGGQLQGCWRKLLPPRPHQHDSEQGRGREHDGRRESYSSRVRHVPSLHRASRRSPDPVRFLPDERLLIAAVERPTGAS